MIAILILQANKEEKKERKKKEKEKKGQIISIYIMKGSSLLMPDRSTFYHEKNLISSM
jgi:hypothetical protein